MKVPIILLSLIMLSMKAYERAVIIRPVADLFFDHLPPQDTGKNSLFNVPYSCNNSKGCLRGAQAIFNETVDILSDHNDKKETHIARYTIFYDTGASDKHFSYWVPSFALMPVNELIKKGIDVRIIPEPIDARNPTSIANNSVITLLFPWNDPVTGITYSVGTRFVRNYQDTSTEWGIVLLDAVRLKSTISAIPKNIGYVYDKKLSRKARKRAYVKLIQRWINECEGIIPYVWGGASFTESLPDNTFYEMRTDFQNSSMVCWHREGSKYPLSGFDCTGLISTAAQIVGLPYFYKNTLTLSHYLKPIKNKIEEGDIIWFPGHAIIVSDIKRNVIIEAAGYQNGFGKVQEIPLYKRFADITTYQQLIHALQQKEPLSLLNAEGAVVRKIPAWNIFSV